MVLIYSQNYEKHINIGTDQDLEGREKKTGFAFYLDYPHQHPEVICKNCSE